MSADDFDAAGFKAVCAALDIETQVVTDAFGRPDVRIDRDGLNKLIAAGLLPEDPTGLPGWDEALRRREGGGSDV
jgi:hypothetical protein